MDYVKFLRRLSPRKNQPTVVTFIGGMGAQIISAAIYFLMKKLGQPVYAEMSYFDKSESVAVVGKVGGCSNWAWQKPGRNSWPVLHDQQHGIPRHCAS